MHKDSFQTATYNNQTLDSEAHSGGRVPESPLFINSLHNGAGKQVHIESIKIFSTCMLCHQAYVVSVTDAAYMLP